MDKANLETYITVIDTGSISLAAEVLHLTQPAVSKRIKTLETQLNVDLFERSGKNLVVTKEGKLFVENARKILKEMDNAVIILNNLNQSVSGSLKIISSHHIGLHRLPPIIKRFTQKYPDVDLQIEFMESESAFEKISKNQADLAFITLDRSNTPSFLNRHTSWKDPMNFVCSTEHKLAKLNKPTLSDLSSHTAILPDKTTLTYALVDHLFSNHHLSLKVRIPTNYLETIKMMMVTGLGWTVLPNTMIDEFVHVIKVQDCPISRELCAISHDQHTLSNAAKAFIEESKKIWKE